MLWNWDTSSCVLMQPVSRQLTVVSQMIKSAENQSLSPSHLLNLKSTLAMWNKHSLFCLN